MYGTIARLRLKPGADAQLAQHLRDFSALNVPGFVATYVYQSDADPNERYMAVLFETKATYERPMLVTRKAPSKTPATNSSARCSPAIPSGMTATSPPSFSGRG
ncbi:MAG TPA: antibiotic biosynthesis monooxygenase [Ktedonobacterales bacterium]|nr:antibiotic biosynthesis monooxygenase [Ktedonobacterales bacterium]